MTRRRLTQIFPFLTPIRQWQKKQEFYLKMKYDGRHYSTEKQEQILPYMVYETETELINPNTGMDILYQYNKVHNLRLVSNTINHIVIAPYETFSFWRLAKNAHLYGKYEDGLVVVDGKLVPSKGGGLCQMSNTLFSAFLHTPLTIVERHPHQTEEFPSPDPDTPYGTDATINEGWQDLKVFNNTTASYQIIISFTEDRMKISIFSDQPFLQKITIHNGNIRYQRKDSSIFQDAEVYAQYLDLMTGTLTDKLLYVNHCEIGYALDPSIEIEEE